MSGGWVSAPTHSNLCKHIGASFAHPSVGRGRSRTLGYPLRGLGPVRDLEARGRLRAQRYLNGTGQMTREESSKSAPALQFLSCDYSARAHRRPLCMTAMSCDTMRRPGRSGQCWYEFYVVDMTRLAQRPVGQLVPSAEGDHSQPRLLKSKGGLLRQGRLQTRPSESTRLVQDACGQRWELNPDGPIDSLLGALRAHLVEAMHRRVAAHGCGQGAEGGIWWASLRLRLRW